jgi:hypothetical protein
VEIGGTNRIVVNWIGEQTWLLSVVTKTMNWKQATNGFRREHTWMGKPRAELIVSAPNLVAPFQLKDDLSLISLVSLKPWK